MNNNDTYLAHHGIKGQKWGIRRYQNADGSLTAEGRKRKGLSEPRKSLKERLSNKKAAQEKTPEQKNEELKEYLRNNPKKMPKYGRELSKADAEEVMRNIEFDRRLKDIKKAETDRGFQKINSLNNRIQTISNLVNTSVNAYNNMALVYNAYYDVQAHNGRSMGKMKKMPKVGWGKKGVGGAFYAGDSNADEDKD